MGYCFFPEHVVVVVVVVLTFTRITKSVVTEQVPVTLELRNTSVKKQTNQRWYTHMSQLTQLMPPPETYTWYKVIYTPWGAHRAGRAGGVSGYHRAWYRSVS